MSTQEENNQNIVFSYCREENCTGTPSDAVADPDEDRDCPICFDSIGGQRVTMLKPCKHFFCLECSQNYRSGGTCPVCKATATHIFQFSTPTVSEVDNKDAMDRLHCDCNFPELKEYLECLNTEWFTFAKFMLLESNKPNNANLKGPETLKLQRFEDEGRLLRRTQKYVFLITEQGEKRLVLCFTLPSLSIRLVITKQDDIDYEVDNDYADTVIGWMNIQMRACWRVIPDLISRKFSEKMFVRKFENVNCFLLFTGFEDCGFYIYHYDNMRFELGSLKQYNFDEAFNKRVRNVFPPLSLQSIASQEDSHFFCDCRLQDERVDEETGIIFRRMSSKDIIKLYRKK